MKMKTEKIIWPSYLEGDMKSNAETSEVTIESSFHFELFCWTAVMLTPILCWVNGPSVSTDQFVTRIVVFTLALIGAVGIRSTKVFLNRRLLPRQCGDCGRSINCGKAQPSDSD